MNRRNFLTSSAAIGAASFRPFEAALAGVHTGSDSIVVNGLDASTMNGGFLELLRKGGVDCVHKSVGDFASYGEIFKLVDERPDELMVARSVADIVRAKQEGKISVLLGTQAANHLERLYRKFPFEYYEPMRLTLRAHHELGLRFQGICYNVTNMFGGGCLDPRVPLTRAGKELVKAVHDLKIILDVGGHTGEQTSFDAIEMSSGVPIVCTHSNMAAINPNLRAISDRLAEAIAETGGVIGLTAVSDFLTRSRESLERYPERSPRAQLSDILDQYDHLKKVVGIDHVGLGPDFIWGWGGQDSHDPEDDVIFPNEVMGSGVGRTVNGFEDISELPNLVNGLRGRGWTNAELDKMLGENWLRVYRQVWGG